MQRIGCFGPDISIELRHIASRPKIGRLIIEQECCSAQYGVVAIPKKLRLAAGRADPHADDVGLFRRRRDKGVPLLVVEIGLPVNKQLLGLVAMRLGVGLQHKGEQVLRRGRLEMKLVVSGLPRSIGAAEYDTVSLIEKHLRCAAGMTIGIVR